MNENSFNVKISGSFEEITELLQLAESQGKTVSRFVLDSLVHDDKAEAEKIYKELSAVK